MIKRTLVTSSIGAVLAGAVVWAHGGDGKIRPFVNTQMHGAGGTGTAPPPIHPIYKPRHHPDAAFLRAAMDAVQSHHWSFGDMPPVEGISEKEVELIATFIRDVQRANGIE